MMRMIKNLKKKRSADKKGVILVTVLFILAMAMIFISCALLLTSASRSRVYEKTQSTQARLTLTSAIESFYQALSMQEISDAALESYADFGADMQVIMDDNTVPGMYPAGPGGTDNCTRAKFAKTTLNGKEYIVVDFTTIIGAKVDGDGNPVHNPDGTIKYNQENARLFLYETTTPDPPDLFSTQVDFNGPLANNFRASIGKGAPAGATDNTVVWRGDYHSNQSQGTEIWSDMFFLGDGAASGYEAYFENNEDLHGDTIFMDNYRLSFNSTAVSFGGDVYFLGPNARYDSFTGNDSASRTYAKSGTTWVFANRKTNANNQNNVMGAISSADVLFLKTANDGWDASLAGGISGANNYTTNMTSWKNKYDHGDKNAKVTKAKRYYTTDTSSLVQVYPTTAQMKSQYGMPTSAGDCTGYITSESLVSLINKYKNGNNGGIVPEGNYLLSGGSYSKDIKNSTPPDVVCLDGTKDYIFFINGTSYLEGVVFAVVNPTQDHHQYFILGPSSNLTLNNVNSGDTGRVACGFLSVTRSGCTDAASYCSTIGSMSMNACHNAYDGVQKPTIQIYAMNNNTIEVIRGTAIEAYVGMFQNTYGGSQTSLFKVHNGSNGRSFNFYGRIMAANIFCNAADFDMPYCPAPNVHNYEEYTEVSSKYKVASLQYYYGDGTLPADG